MPPIDHAILSSSHSTSNMETNLVDNCMRLGFGIIFAPLSLVILAGAYKLGWPGILLQVIGAYLVCKFV